MALIPNLRRLKRRAKSVYSANLLRLRRLAEPRFVSALELSDSDTLRCLDPDRVPTGSSDAAAPVLEIVGSGVQEKFPGLPSSLTDLRVDLAQLTDEAIVARAKRCQAFDLHPSGIQPDITSDGQIDWSCNPSGDPAWHRMLHRHAWWVVLARAYQVSGDEGFARTFCAQLDDWIFVNPPPPYKTETSPSWRLMEVGLRIRLSWLPCMAAFWDADCFTDGLKLRMVRSLLDHGRFLSRYYTNRNHLVRESNGLLSLATYASFFVESGEWHARALARLTKELEGQVNDDGWQIEMSTGYQWLSIDEFEYTYDLLSEAGDAVAAKQFGSTVEDMYAALAWVMRPDGSFPQLNDGFMLWGARRLEAAGRKFARPDLEFIATSGRDGNRPDVASKSFGDAGLHVMRSGWDTSAKYLVMDSGPFGGPHGHEDMLSIELFCGGVPFIVDPGSYTYDKKNRFRNYFASSFSHNTVTVDGQSQARRWQGQNMSPQKGQANPATWKTCKEFDLAVASYGDGYGEFSILKPVAGSIDRTVVHTRAVLFMKPDYWLIIDQLDATGTHSYDYWYHTSPGVSVRIAEAGNSALLDSEAAHERLQLSVFATSTASLSVESGLENPVQGWYSSDHHKIETSPVLRIAATANRIVSIVVAEPVPKVGPQSGSHIVPHRLPSGGMALEIHRGNTLDLVAFNSAATTPIQLAGRDVPGPIGVVRINAAQNLVEASLSADLPTVSCTAG